MKSIIIIVFIVNTIAANAQVITHSKAHIKTEAGNKIIQLESQEATVTFNTLSNLFKLTIPMHSLDSELDTLDRLFDTYEMAFVFIGKSPITLQQLIAKEQSVNTITLTDGTCTLNGKYSSCKATASIFKQNNEALDDLKNVRVSLFIEVLPQTLNITNYFSQIINPITIEIDETFLNIEE